MNGNICGNLEKDKINIDFFWLTGNPFGNIYIKKGHLFNIDMSRIDERLLKKGNVIEVVFPSILNVWSIDRLDSKVHFVKQSLPLPCSYYQWWIQDFPGVEWRRRRAIPEGVRQPIRSISIIRQHFCRKLHENERIWTATVYDVKVITSKKLNFKKSQMNLGYKIFG